MYIEVSSRIGYLEPQHFSDRPALGYIRGDRYSFAVDTGASKMHVEQFYSELEKRGLRLPDFTGISHYHWDHSYAAAYVNGLTVASDRCNAMLVKESAYEWTPEAMKDRLTNGEDIKFGYCAKLCEYTDLSMVKVVPADIVISGNITVDLGGVHVEVLYCGGPHSDDHLMFFVPEEKFLFVSDCSGKELFTLDWDYDETRPELLPDVIETLPYNKSKLAPYVELLESLDFEYCVLGHADKMLTKAELLGNLLPHLK